MFFFIRYDSKFSYYSDLKPNFYKCEIAGIGSLKGVDVAVFGINCVNLKVKTIKILEIDFSYNKLNMAKNFWTAISNIQNVLKIWRMRNLTLESKTIVHLCLTSIAPKRIIEEKIENIQTNFLWNRSTPKTKHSTLCYFFTLGGRRNVDINTKNARI